MSSQPLPDELDARNGSDSDVLATLVANHRRFLSFLAKRLGDRELAEDILQSAFVRSIERAPDGLTSETAVVWFFRVLRNAIVDHHRRRRSVERSVGETEIDFSQLAEDGDLLREACQCILDLAGTLKPEYADALKRVDVEGKAVQDFAKEAGITPNNASVRLFRAREALGKRLQATCRTCADHGCLDCTCGTAGPHR
ncbi:MAG TPA: sigma-70 family RNA polymerase sigma factor [Planctomycetota bacterium]|nr:sigma-70 family RNA polymerase sigma factor [Planctomycetota bacterium]